MSARFCAPEDKPSQSGSQSLYQHPRGRAVQVTLRALTFDAFGHFRPTRGASQTGEGPPS